MYTLMVCSTIWTMTFHCCLHSDKAFCCSSTFTTFPFVEPFHKPLASAEPYRYIEKCHTFTNMLDILNGYPFKNYFPFPFAPPPQKKNTLKSSLLPVYKVPFVRKLRKRWWTRSVLTFLQILPQSFARFNNNKR